jgi:hypothetical protein
MQIIVDETIPHNSEIAKSAEEFFYLYEKRLLIGYTEAGNNFRGSEEAYYSYKGKCMQ